MWVNTCSRSTIKGLGQNENVQKSSIPTSNRHLSTKDFNNSYVISLFLLRDNKIIKKCDFTILTHFSSMFHFYTPLNALENQRFPDLFSLHVNGT